MDLIGWVWQQSRAVSNASAEIKTIYDLGGQYDGLHNYDRGNRP